jgi:Flp pilus assembly protein TadD
MHRQVVNAVDAGEGDLRVRELRARLAAYPDDLPARLELAKRYSAAGFPEVAIEHYRLAAARWPDNAGVAVLLARSLDAAGATAEARMSIEGFLAAHAAPAAGAWSWAGILQDRTGDYPAGERSHRKAVEQQSGSAPLHNNLGYNLLLQGRHAEAAEEFRRALGLEPGSAIARSNLAIALAERPAEAVETWASVTDPASAHNNLGAILLERGDHAGARRAFQTALGYNNHHPAALSNLRLVDIRDGGAELPAAGSQSAWRRFVRTLGIVLLGEETGQATTSTPAPAAGKHQTARQRAGFE